MVDDRHQVKRTEGGVKDVRADQQQGKPQPRSLHKQVQRVEEGEEDQEWQGVEEHPEFFSGVHQHADMSLDRRGQSLQIVAAFENGDDRPLQHWLGDLLDDARELGIALGGDFHAAERVALVGVEARGDEHELRHKAIAAGRSFCSKASRYSLSPEPPGSGTLIVKFRPLPRPFSEALPEPG